MWTLWISWGNLKNLSDELLLKICRMTYKFFFLLFLVKLCWFVNLNCWAQACIFILYYLSYNKLFYNLIMIYLYHIAYRFFVLVYYCHWIIKPSPSENFNSSREYIPSTQPSFILLGLLFFFPKRKGYPEKFKIFPSLSRGCRAIENSFPS